MSDCLGSGLEPSTDGSTNHNLLLYSSLHNFSPPFGAPLLATNCGFFTTASFLDVAITLLSFVQQLPVCFDFRADNSLCGGVQRRWVAQRRTRVDAHVACSFRHGDRLPPHRSRWF